MCLHLSGHIHITCHVVLNRQWFSYSANSSLIYTNPDHNTTILPNYTTFPFLLNNMVFHDDNEHEPWISSPSSNNSQESNSGHNIDQHEFNNENPSSSHPISLLYHGPISIATTNPINSPKNFSVPSFTYTSPWQPNPLPSYLMVTRDKANIFKPKTLLTNTQQPTTPKPWITVVGNKSC